MELGRRRQGWWFQWSLCSLTSLRAYQTAPAYQNPTPIKKKQSQKIEKYDRKKMIKILFFLTNPPKNTKNMIFEIFNILKFLRFWIRDFEILKMSTSSDNCFINLKKSVHSKPYTFLKLHNHPDTFLKSWENRMWGIFFIWAQSPPSFGFGVIYLYIYISM